MNSTECIARVRSRSAGLRRSQEVTWKSNAFLLSRKFLHVGPIPLRMLAPSFWNWLALVCLGAVLSFVFQRAVLLFGVADLASHLILQTTFAVGIAFLSRRKKHFLDQLDVPLLDHFSTLPWSNRRLLVYFLIAEVSRSGLLLAFLTVAGIGLHDGLNIAHPPHLANAILASWAFYVSLLVWKLFLQTLAPAMNQKTFMAATVLVPFAWPYGMLWLSTQGASDVFLVASSTVYCVIVGWLLYVTISRLYRGMPIVEFIGHSPACFAIPQSELAGFLRHQEFYDQSSNGYSEATVLIPSIEKAVHTGFLEMDSKWKSRMAYSITFWSRQGWVHSLANRFLTEREKQIVALAEWTRNEQDFATRFIRLCAIQVLIVLSVVCLMWLSKVTMFGFLLDRLANILLIGSGWPLIHYLSYLVGKVSMITLRTMPYSSREIVWALTKRCWIESLFLLPVVLFTVYFGVAMSTGLASEELLARMLLIATVILVSLPLVVVSFRLQENTNQSAMNLESLRFILLFFLGVLGVCATCGMMLLGGAIIAMIGAFLAISVARGIAELFIWIYRSAQLDLK